MNLYYNNNNNTCIIINIIILEQEKKANEVKIKFKNFDYLFYCFDPIINKLHVLRQ